ncbi:hypothetical protein E2320_000285 [Naja naja]|nr:hypothetical protein E2320_000285 [Naja naja]
MTAGSGLRGKPNENLQFWNNLVLKKTKDHVWFQEAFEKVLAFLRDPQVAGDGDPFLLVAKHLGNVCVVKGQVGTKHDVKDHAHAPHVAFPAVMGYPLQHFGGRVGRAAAEGLAQLLAVLGEQLGKAKVCQFQVEPLQEGILTLEVTMRHPAAVAIADGFYQLTEERFGPALRQGSPLQDAVKDIAVLCQLHHQVDLSICGLQHLIHPDDVLVV